MATLKPITRPKAGDDVGDLWKVVDALAVFANSFLGGGGRIISSLRNALTICEGGSTIEYVAGGGGSVEVAPLSPWQPYAAPYTGSGTPPADWGLNFMVRPGNVSDGSQIRVPSMRNQVFTAPANCTGGLYGWLDATVSAQGTMTALDYGSGTSLPDALTLDPADDNPPPHAYALLFILTSTATSVEWANVEQQQSAALNLTPQVTGLTQNGVGQRRMIFTAA